MLVKGACAGGRCSIACERARAGFYLPTYLSLTALSCLVRAEAHHTHTRMTVTRARAFNKPKAPFARIAWHSLDPQNPKARVTEHEKEWSVGVVRRPLPQYGQLRRSPSLHMEKCPRSPCDHGACTKVGFLRVEGGSVPNVGGRYTSSGVTTRRGESGEVGVVVDLPVLRDVEKLAQGLADSVFSCRSLVCDVYVAHHFSIGGQNVVAAISPPARRGDRRGRTKTDRTNCCKRYTRGSCEEVQMFAFGFAPRAGSGCGLTTAQLAVLAPGTAVHVPFATKRPRRSRCFRTHIRLASSRV